MRDVLPLAAPCRARRGPCVFPGAPCRGARRRQFGAPGQPETLLNDYPTHQRRLFPLLAEAYVLHFAHARLVGQQTPEVQQVLVRLDWQDINGRPLLWRPSERFCEGV